MSYYNIGYVIVEIETDLKNKTIYAMVKCFLTLAVANRCLMLVLIWNFSEIILVNFHSRRIQLLRKTPSIVSTKRDAYWPLNCKRTVSHQSCKRPFDIKPWVQNELLLWEKWWSINSDSFQKYIYKALHEQNSFASINALKLVRLF